jgi:dihydroanticapsin dehydrogenase
VERVVKKALQDFPRVDILVNNAGIWRPGHVVDLDEDTWDAVLSTNLKSDFMVSKYIVPEMMK